MLAYLLSVVVTGTLPWLLAGPDHCSPGTLPMTDLDSVRAVYRVSGESFDRLAVQAQVRGMEGLPWSATIPTSAVATVWYDTKRMGAMLWSCHSNMIGVNLTLDVPPSRVRAQSDRMYDLAGRRLLIAPTMRGTLYYVRRLDGTSWCEVVK